MIFYDKVGYILSSDGVCYTHELIKPSNRKIKSRSLRLTKKLHKNVIAYIDSIVAIDNLDKE